MAADRTRPDLDVALAGCLASFRADVLPTLTTDEPGRLRFATFAAAWDRYYFGPFARFDALLKQDVEAGGRDYVRFMHVSVPHHNLHRLAEVLRRDVDGGTLVDSHSPERVADLVAVCIRLEELIATECGTTPAAAGAAG